jgi:hypothetical protein
MSITESLFAALVRLRDGHNQRVLWADALCINQQDRQEKSRQVQMMSRIYSLAENVAVVLGTEWDGYEMAFEYLHLIAQDSKAHFSTRNQHHVQVSLDSRSTMDCLRICAPCPAETY